MAKTIYHKNQVKGLPTHITIRCNACGKKVKAYYHHAREYASSPRYVINITDPYFLVSYLISAHSIGFLKPRCRASNRMIHRRYTVKWSAGRPIMTTSYKKVKKIVKRR